MKHLVILCIVVIFTFNYNNNNNVHGASLLLQNKQQKTIDSNNNNNNNAIIPKRPADQDEYEAYMSGEKKLVTSFQVTPVVATNTECIKKNTNCQWRELGIHERSSGFIMLRNNNNMKDPSHQFGISCIICGTDTLCSDPDEHAMKTTIDMNSKDGTVQHQIRMDKLVEQVTKKCKTVMPERKLSMKHLRTIHQGLGSLMGMPESVGAGMIGANVGASDMLEDDRFGSLEDGLKVIDGTKALSPSRLNGLVIGKDVNNGDVKNSKKYVNPAKLRKLNTPLKQEKEDANDATGPSKSNGAPTGPATLDSTGPVATANSTKSKVDSTGPAAVVPKNNTKSKKASSKKRKRRSLLEVLAITRRKSLQNIEQGPTPKDFLSFKLNSVYPDGVCGSAGYGAEVFKNVFMGKNNQFQFSCLDNKELCYCISIIGKSGKDVSITDSKYTFKLKGDGEICTYQILENKQQDGNDNQRRRRLLHQRNGGPAGKC